MGIIASFLFPKDVLFGGVQRLRFDKRVMMSSGESAIAALFDLKSKVQTAVTFDEISDACCQYVRRLALGSDGGVAAQAQPGSTAYVTIPLTPHLHKFWIYTPTPLTSEQTQYLEVGASVVATAPLLQSGGRMVNGRQQALLTQLSQKIAEQSRFTTILSLLQTSFTESFPGGVGRIWLVDPTGEEFELCGHFPEELDGDDTLDKVIGATVLQGETTVIIHDDITHCYVPIHYGGHYHAILHFTQLDGRPISPPAMGALAQLAELLAIGLSHESLSNQAWQRANQLETIYRVTESARGLRPLELTLVEIHQQILHSYKAPTCLIALVNQELKSVTYPCVWVDGAVASRSLTPLGAPDNLVAWVIQNNEPLAIDNWQEDKRPFDDPDISPETASIICVPMRVGEEVLGAISIQHHQPMAFNASDYQTLTAIAAHAGVIIQNARLYANAREMVDLGTRDLQTAVSLRQAIADISTSLVQDEVAKQLLFALAKVINYTQAWAILLDGQRFQAVYGRNFYDKPLNIDSKQFQELWQHHPWITNIIQSQEHSVKHNLQDEPQWPKQVENPKFRSWMAAPLVAGKRLLGILVIESDNQRAFDSQVEWIVSSLATHAGVAIQNAQLFQQTQQQLLELGTLHQASATMTANLDQKAVLQTVTSEMVNALQLDSCTIFVWNSINKSLLPTAHKSKYSEPQTDLDEQKHQVGLAVVDDLEQSSIIKNVLKSRQIIILRMDEIDSDEELALLEASKLKSMMLVPLVRRGIVMGILAMGQTDEPRTYSERELRLAQNLAGQAAVAIEHSQLYGQAQRRIDELSTFHEIVLKLNSPLKLNSVLDTITESALKLIDATNLHIFLYDEKTRQFTKGSALWRDGRRTAAVQKPRADGQGLTASVVNKGQPIVINNAADHPYYQSKESQAWGICAIAGFPLKYGDEVLGAFTMTYLHPHTFTDDELLLLNLLAEQAAVAVRNASLYAESQRRLRDMSALVDMAKQVTSDLNLTAVLQTTVQILRGLMNARASTIIMLSEDGEELILRAADGVNNDFVNARMAIDDSISGQVVNSMKLVYINDTHDEPDFIFFDEVVRSLLVVPLIMRDRAVGTLTVDSDQANAFQESDIQLMTIAAAQVSIAISNARLFEESEARASELKIAYDELKESDRLKDELVQNVSHELRTPLTFVKGYVDLLMDGEMGLMNEEQQSALTIISDKTNDITRIIDDIITLQKINSGNLKREKTSMREFLETAVASHQMIASQKGLHIESRLPEDDGVVIIDRGRINQVLDNLIGNAMKFSPDGGTITISMTKEDDMVTVAVSDEGIGISPDKHRRIFERFYQIDGSASRRFGGTGIGLAIVKRIIDAHSGKIWVESEENRGSAFTFQIPLASDTP